MFLRRKLVVCVPSETKRNGDVAGSLSGVGKAREGVALLLGMLLLRCVVEWK